MAVWALLLGGPLVLPLALLFRPDLPPTLAEVGSRVTVNLHRLLAVLRDEPHPEPLVRDENPTASIGHSGTDELDERTRLALDQLTQLDQSILALARPLGARVADRPH